MKGVGNDAKPNGQSAKFNNIRGTIVWWNKQGYGGAQADPDQPFTEQFFIHKSILSETQQAGEIGIGSSVVANIIRTPNDKGPRAVSLSELTRPDVTAGSERKPDGPRCTLKKYLAHKGYGFLAPVDGGDDIFFHVSALKNSRINPESLVSGETQLIVSMIDKQPKGPVAVRLALA